MKYTIKKLLEIAAAEIGYKEKETNAHLDDKTANAGDNNWTKYARDLHAAGYYQAPKNGYAWCDMFVDWCFLQLAGGDPVKAQEIICQTGPYGAGCEFSARYYKQQNRYHTTNPQPGDQIFFGRNGAYEHTGIVEKIVGSTIHTIEGNTSNQVARRTYSMTSSYVMGFGRPKFDEDEEQDQEPEQEDEEPISRPGKVAVGDIVTFNGTKHYTSANSTKPVSCRPGKAKVTQIYKPESSKHPYHLVREKGGTSNVYGWVDAADIWELGQPQSESEQPVSYKVGDIVKFTGNTHHTSANAAVGKPCKPGKAKITQIFQLGKSKHPYHLVRVGGDGATVYGWVDEGTFTKA